MIGESLAILAVILVMSFMFARSGKRIFAAFTLPLISIPLLHLIGYIFGAGSAQAILDIAAFVIGVALCFFFSRSFEQRRARVGYLFFCCIFMAGLLIAYLLYLF